MRLIAGGIDAKQIAAWQGHTDGGVLIQNTYSQVFSDDDHVKEQAKLRRMEELIPFRLAI